MIDERTSMAKHTRSFGLVFLALIVVAVLMELLG